MKKEKSYFAGTAFFDNEFIAIIPKEGHTDWRQGVYTLHICGENYGDDLPGKVDYICKIESCRSEEDLKSKLQIDKKKYPKNMVHHGAYSMVPKNYKK